MFTQSDDRQAAANAANFSPLAEKSTYKARSRKRRGILDGGVSDVTLLIRTEAFTQALLSGGKVLVCHKRGPPRNLS